MKKKELNEFRTKDVKEMARILADKKMEIIKVLANVRVSREKNLKKVKSVRREIAQISTIIHEAETTLKEREEQKV